MGVPAFLVASTVLSAGSSMAAASAVRKSKIAEGKQLIALGKSEYAAGTRKAQEARRRSDMLTSDIRAAQAAGGGGFDEGAIETLADAAGVGELNVLSELFEGETALAGRKRAAYGKALEGKMARSQGEMKALATIMSGASKHYSGFKSGGSSGSGGLGLPMGDGSRYANYS